MARVISLPNRAVPQKKKKKKVMRFG